VLSKKATKFVDVKKEVDELFKNFTGKGEIIVHDIETGAYLENQLSEKETDYFRCKCYTFNNQTGDRI
jgi:hypothetical protein